MVFPLMLAAYGLQAYGANQRTQAQRNASNAYNEWLARNNQTQNASDEQLQAYLNQISGAYDQDVSGLVDQFQPATRMDAFNAGSAQQHTGVQQVLNTINARNPTYAPATGLFANAQSAAQARATAAEAPSIEAASLAGGLRGLSERDSRVGSDFGFKAKGYSTKITDAMRLYHLSNAMRNQALARAGWQNQQDMSQAQSAGNGAMLAGGLLGAGAQAYGSYQANQPSAADPSYQSNLDSANGTGYNPFFSQYGGAH